MKNPPYKEIVMNRNVIIGLSLVVLVFVGLIVKLSSKSEQSHPDQTNLVGRPAPAFALKDLDGKEVNLSDFKGKVVILDFWATWCGPCVMEIPHFIELQKQYKDQGVAIVGISVDSEGIEVVKSFVQKHQVNYPILMADAKVQQSYGEIQAIPTTFVLDTSGIIQKQYIGYRDKSVFEADIKKLLVTGTIENRNDDTSLHTRQVHLAKD